MSSAAAENVVLALTGLVAITFPVCCVMLSREFQRNRTLWARWIGRLSDFVIDNAMHMVVAALLLGALELALRATMVHVAAALLWLLPLCVVSVLAPWSSEIHRSVVYLPALMFAYSRTLDFLLPDGAEGTQAMGAFLTLGLFLLLLSASLVVRLIVGLYRWGRSIARATPPESVSRPW